MRWLRLPPVDRRSRPALVPLSYQPLYVAADETSERWKTVAAIAALVLLVLGSAAWAVVNQRMTQAGTRDPVTLCLQHRPPPRSVLTLLDVTDTLAADSGHRFAGLIRLVRDDLPRNGRLTIVPFGGELGRSLNPAFDVCSPGRGAEANEAIEGRAKVERDYVEKFGAPLDRVAGLLRRADVSGSSPIAEQIERAATDPAIPWSGAERELVVLSDGLQNTRASRVYAGEPVRLPDPPEGLLAGVTVHFVELTNPHYSNLQTSQMRATWKAWFEAAGAEAVYIYAPGYPTPSAGYGLR